MRKFTYVPIILAFLVHFSLQATNYYVSPYGDDYLNNGTSIYTPWQTLQVANQHNFEPGDTLFLEAYKTFYGTLKLNLNDSGTPENPVVVTTYNGSDAAARATIFAGDSCAVLISDMEGIHLKNIIAQGNGLYTYKMPGIHVFNTLPNNTKLRNFRLENLEIFGFKDAGIRIEAAGYDNSRSGFIDFDIVGCSSHDNLHAGIEVINRWNVNATDWCSSDFYIGYCKTYNNRGITDSWQHSGSGIQIGGVDGVVIEYCESYNNGENNNWPSGPVGIWVWDTNNALIQYCESHHNNSTTIDGGGFDFDGGVTNSVLQYNYSHDNYGPGYLIAQFCEARPFYNNIIRYNISENDAENSYYSSIHLWACDAGTTTVHNVDIHNNTVYKDAATTSGTGGAIEIQTDHFYDTKVFNNIFITNGTTETVKSRLNADVKFWGNNYWAADGNLVFYMRWDKIYHSLEEWRNGVFQERWIDGTNTGFNVNPLLYDAGGGGTVGSPELLNTGSGLWQYYLQPLSPLINQGVAIFDYLNIDDGNQDYYRNALPTDQTYDVGAYERGAMQEAEALLLQISRDSEIVPLEGQVNLTYTLTNLGTTAVDSVIISDLLPLGVQYYLKNNPQGIYDAATDTWTLMQSIGAGAEVTLNLTAVAKTEGIHRIEMDSLEVGGQMYQLNRQGTCITTPYKVCNNEVISIEVSAPDGANQYQWHQLNETTQQYETIAGATAQYYTITAVGSYRYTLNGAFLDTNCTDSSCCPIIVSGENCCNSCYKIDFMRD
ncbi:MAG: DUF11 domain-containing protein [Sphingobacteriales bacterium]|nr:DUF11 domain-containing protein [Sphingobacteriales bacterium]